ncbi:hypothetical protein [Proteus phage vB_PmiP_RS51pmB]|nr:hypothetical protein [Proteus phage vB_PmiP_RS51pmB]
MRVRKLDANHDWMFGRGQSDYHTASDAVAQRVKTTLLSITNDWFLDESHGIPWFDFWVKNPPLMRMEIDIKSAILNIDGVERIDSFDLQITEKRVCIIELSYTDAYGNQLRSIVNVDGNK